MSVQALLGEVAAGLVETRARKRRNADSLLKRVFNGVTTLRKARELFADQLAPDFRLFDYLRTDEYGLSRCLADLLNPRRPHGQGRLFLDAFLERIGSGDWKKTGECRVITEKMTDQGRRIDIVLELQNGMIGIENKPWAGDQDRQLYDYAEWLKKTARHGNWLLVYLSNRDPDPNSLIEDERRAIGSHFFQMDYHEVIDWLQDGAQKTRALTVRIFVEELIKFIRYSVNREAEMSEEREIKGSMLASPENLEAAFLVTNAWESVKRDLVEKFKQDISRLASEKGYRLELNEAFFSGKGENDLGIFFSEKQDERLVFGFEANWFREFYFGIARTSPEVAKSDESKTAIENILTSTFGFPSSATNDHYPWWMYADGRVLDQEFRHWLESPKPWQAMRDGSLAEKFIEIADRVHEAFRDRMDLLLPETAGA